MQCDSSTSGRPSIGDVTCTVHRRITQSSNCSRMSAATSCSMSEQDFASRMHLTVGTATLPALQGAKKVSAQGQRAHVEEGKNIKITQTQNTCFILLPSSNLVQECTRRIVLNCGILHSKKVCINIFQAPPASQHPPFFENNLLQNKRSIDNFACLVHSLVGSMRIMA